MHQIPDQKSWDIQTKLQKNHLIKLYQISIQMKSIEKLITLEKSKNFIALAVQDLLFHWVV